MRLRALVLTALALGANASCLGADADCPVLDKVAWTLPVTTQEIIATKAVTIEWTSGFHDVWKMSSKAALDACSFEAAQLVGGPARSPPRCKDDVCSAVVPLPEAGSTDYYACNVGSHCEAGMILAITGALPIDPVPGDKDVAPPGGDPDPQPQPANTVAALIKLDPDLSKFEKLLEEHELDDKLEKEGPWTVFGPTDKAIDDINLAEQILLELDGNGIAKYHIIKGQGLAAADLTDGMVLETWQGDTLEVQIAEGGVFIVDGFDQKALVIKADQEGSNGYLHLVDTMLFWTADDNDGGSSDSAFSLGPAFAAIFAAALAALY